MPCSGQRNMNDRTHLCLHRTWRGDIETTGYEPFERERERGRRRLGPNVTPTEWRHIGVRFCVPVREKGINVGVRCRALVSAI